MAFSPYSADSYGRMPADELDDERKDGSAPGQSGADAGAPGTTGPAPYMPNSPSQGGTATAPQPSGRMPSMPAETPRTFAQMQDMGEARPPAPVTRADPTMPWDDQQQFAPSSRATFDAGGTPGLVGNPAGITTITAPPNGLTGSPNGPTMVNSTAAPPAQWSLSDPRTQAQILQEDYGGDTAKFLAASPNASVSALANTPGYSDMLDKGYSVAPNGQMFDSQGHLVGSNPALASSVAAVNNPKNQTTGTAIGAGGVGGIGGNGQPIPGSPTSYLQGGLQTDASGTPVQGGYNALTDLYRQLGTTPGSVNPQVADLIKQNPALLNTLPPEQAATLRASLNFSPGGSGTTPGSSTPASGIGASTGTTFSTGGTSGTGATGSNGTLDLLSLLLNGANGKGAGSAVQDATQRNTLDLLNNPSPYNQKAVQDEYNTLGGQIDDQYALQQNALDEEMARRGLGVSTNKAGRLNDLNIGKRSAKEALASDLANKFATTSGQYQTNAINTGNTVGSTAQSNNLNWLGALMGYGQNAFNNDLATNLANQNQQNSYQDFILRLLGLGYGAAA